MPETAGLLALDLRNCESESSIDCSSDRLGGSVKKEKQEHVSNGASRCRTTCDVDESLSRQAGVQGCGWGLFDLGRSAAPENSIKRVTRYQGSETATTARYPNEVFCLPHQTPNP
ncbi:hypothetical protein AAFF_G00368830 [Aldrovandia affinis]|uniref:Uncharacterized protein n=1 Tax=Aldrovandia affinis TaxID=143900 RepID=A0AAD7SGY1_9TELE|nr:hypothetical protein AAFF_G00368830 [Aldrovandia affinis]